jgi:hypothetical protein
MTKVKNAKICLPRVGGVHAESGIVPRQQWFPAYAGRTNVFLSCTENCIIRHSSILYHNHYKITTIAAAASATAEAASAASAAAVAASAASAAEAASDADTSDISADCSAVVKS